VDKLNAKGLLGKAQGMMLRKGTVCITDEVNESESTKVSQLCAALQSRASTRENKLKQQKRSQSTDFSLPG
jgi:hypothetical protein